MCGAALSAPSSAPGRGTGRGLPRQRQQTTTQHHSVSLALFLPGGAKQSSDITCYIQPRFRGAGHTRYMMWTRTANVRVMLQTTTICCDAELLPSISEFRECLLPKLSNHNACFDHVPSERTHGAGVECDRSGDHRRRKADDANGHATRDRCNSAKSPLALRHLPDYLGLLPLLYACASLAARSSHIASME
jgi:hypothetical protein